MGSKGPFALQCVPALCLVHVSNLRSNCPLVSILHKGVYYAVKWPALTRNLRATIIYQSTVQSVVLYFFSIAKRPRRFVNREYPLRRSPGGFSS